MPESPPNVSPPHRVLTRRSVLLSVLAVVAIGVAVPRPAAAATTGYAGGYIAGGYC